MASHCHRPFRESPSLFGSCTPSTSACTLCQGSNERQPQQADLLLELWLRLPRSSRWLLGCRCWCARCHSVWIMAVSLTKHSSAMGGSWDSTSSKNTASEHVQAFGIGSRNEGCTRKCVGRRRDLIQNMRAIKMMNSLNYNILQHITPQP